MLTQYKHYTYYKRFENLRAHVENGKKERKISEQNSKLGTVENR